MNAVMYRQLELKLIEAEDLLFRQAVLGAAALQIRDALHAVIGMVVAERIRAEGVSPNPRE